MVRSVRRPIVLGVGLVVVAGIFAGAVVAGRLDVVGDTASIQRALQEAPLAKVADVPAAPGVAPRSVFVQHADRLVCLWDAPSATSPTRQGGCNLASNPLGESELFVSYSFDGGPEPAEIRDARLVGLASSRVARADVVLSDGTVRSVLLRPAPAAGDGLKAFAYRVPRSELRRGVGPVAVRAFDAVGARIANETGFAG